MKLQRILPTVLGGLLLLGGAAGAWAEGRITFTKLKAERCEEGGSCEWRLACRIGSGRDQDIIAGEEVIGASSLDINKSFDVQSFPVAMACTLFEDDGWFSESWDEVQKESISIPGGGDYTLKLGNNEEGVVNVMLAVDSLEIGTPPAPAAAQGKKPAAPRTWIAVYEKLPGGRAVVVGLPWDQFKARSDRLAAKGSHPTVLETYMDGNRRLWSGIFTSGAEKSEIVPSLEWEAFSGKWKNLTDDGKRLMDLAIYDEKGKRYFTGVFHNGWDTESFWVGQSKDELQRKWYDLSGQSLRLVDLEPYRAESGKLIYASAYRTGSGGYGLWFGYDWDKLYSEWKRASDGGTQLLDIEPYTEGGKRLFDAVLRSGLKGDLQPPSEWPALVSKWKELLGQGQRMVDLETF